MKKLFKVLFIIATVIAALIATGHLKIAVEEPGDEPEEN